MEMMVLCRKTKFVRKEKADLLNPRKSKKMIKIRGEKLTSNYSRSSNRFPKLRKIQIVKFLSDFTKSSKIEPSREQESIDFKAQKTTPDR